MSIRLKFHRGILLAHSRLSVAMALAAKHIRNITLPESVSAEIDTSCRMSPLPARDNDNVHGQSKRVCQRATRQASLSYASSPSSSTQVNRSCKKRFQGEEAFPSYSFTTSASMYLSKLHPPDPITSISSDRRTHCHITGHGPVDALLLRPSTLKPIYRHTSCRATIQPTHLQNQRIHLVLREESHCADLGTTHKVDLENRPVHDSRHVIAISVCRRNTESIRKERITLEEIAAGAAIEPEIRSTCEELAALDHLARDAGEQGKIDGRCVAEGGAIQGGDVDFEVDCAARDLAKIGEERAVLEAGVMRERSGWEDRGKVVGSGGEVVARGCDVLQVVLPWDRHSGGPSFEWPCGHVVRILPIARPRDGDLVLGGGDAIEELGRVGILREIGEASDGVIRREVCPIESPGKVLRCAAA